MEIRRIGSLAEKYILRKLTDRSLLEQLAEESAELSKAALKLIRARGDSENVTPVSEEEAMGNLIEEARDVLAVMWLLGIECNKLAFMSGYWKFTRWAERLGYKAKPECIADCPECKNVCYEEEQK